ncbi:MAG: hypothetical protein HQ488_00190, partial [Parcubacteria group bacterium]|nr:hypothetical protein [Parcubacteria group bacterium]
MVFSTLAIALLAAPSSALAQAPTSIGYNGRLFNASGTALSGTYYFWFNLDDALTAGNEVAADIQGLNFLATPTAAITVTNGFFSLQIPLSTDLGDFVEDLYLEMQISATTLIGAAETLTPRTQMFKTPYSIITQGIENGTSDPASNVSFEGRMYYNTSTDEVMVRRNGAWVQLSSTLDDGYDAFGASAQIITVDDATTGLSFDINTVANLDFDMQSSGDVTFQDSGTAWATLGIDGSDDSFITVDTTAGISLDADAASNFNTSAGNLTLNAEDAALDLDGSSSVTIDSAVGGVSVDGAAASNFTTSAGALTLTSAAAATWSTGAGALSIDGASGINLIGNSSEVDITTTGALDLNSAAGTWDSSAGLAFTGATASTFTTAAGDLTLTASAASVNLVGIEAVGTAIFLDANGVSGAGVTIDTYGSGANTSGIVTTNTSEFEVNSYGLSGAGVDINALAGSITLDTTDGAISLTGGGSSGDISIASAASNITINTSSSSKIINIGTSAFSRQILIGTGDDADTVKIATNTTAADVVQIGHGGDTTSIEMDAGSGGIVADTTAGGTISLDAAGAASNFTLTSDGVAEDLTIALAGATDSSLVLSSTGTAEDALQITTTAGGMNITVGGTAAGEDLDITATGTATEIRVTTASTQADAFRLNASAGGIDIDGNNSTLTVNNAADGAADDITIQLTGAQDSSVHI